jgi:hypothetical protein
MKKIISIIMCILFVAAAALSVSAEESIKVTIEKAEAVFEIPAGGEYFAYTSLETTEPEKYTAQIKDAYYYDTESGSFIHLKEGDQYEGDKSYFVRIRFYAEPGYALDDSVTEYYLNGERSMSIIGENLIETRIDVKYESVDGPEMYQTFPERVKNFFTKLYWDIAYFFEQIGVFFSSLFPKV